MNRTEYFQEVNDNAKRDGAVKNAAEELLDCVKALVVELQRTDRCNAKIVGKACGLITRLESK
jgi:hypothetical protein